MMWDLNPSRADSRASTPSSAPSNGETRGCPSHTLEGSGGSIYGEQRQGEKTDRLPTQGPLMAQSQALTGRQPPGRAAGCSDLRSHTGFRPGRGGLGGGEGRWGCQAGAQEPQPGLRLPPFLPRATAAPGWGRLCEGREPPHSQFPRPPAPAPAVGAAAVTANSGPGNHKAGAGRRRGRLVPDVGAQKLPEWGAGSRGALRVEGRSGTVCPDPGVVEGAGVGSPGALGFLLLMLGIYSNWAGPRASSGERCQGMNERRAQPATGCYRDGVVVEGGAAGTG